ncbi:MAG: hypothetical protein KBT20_04115 [Bacteroidales bacterium]|nr:hypothetical protein [Candidatus Liminaster caballi]
MNKKTKKIRDYIRKGVRRLKHRKGFGVHSPFAFAIITEVIEEKLPYYAYQSMQRLYHKQAPLPMKVAALLFRLANRFHARRIIEIGCDGGYSLLPALMADSRNEVISLATAEQMRHTEHSLVMYRGHYQRVSFIESIAQLPDDYLADMIIVNGRPSSMTDEEFVSWIQMRIHDSSIIFVRGIQPGHMLESFWDTVCDNDAIEVTMDLYDYGLAIHRQHFFKQHYIVSF